VYSRNKIPSPDTRIMIPHTTPKRTGKNAISPSGAAGGATVGPKDTVIDTDLEAVIQAWAELPESVKDAVMGMVRG
jgi:hypothetical protein